MNIKKIMPNLVKTCRLTFLALIISIGAGGQLIAETYPDDLPPNTQGRSAGSRGCSMGEANDVLLEEIPSLILLSSGGRAATVSVRPTFIWFSRDEHVDVQNFFRLYEFNDENQTYQLLVELENEMMPTGVLMLPFSADLDSLSPSKRYLWQIELTCDPDSPSSNLFAEAEFEVIMAPSNLSRERLTGMTNMEQMEAYAAENLWYDALPLVLTSTHGDNDANALKQRLFEQVAISDIERYRFENSEILETMDYENSERVMEYVNDKL